ncbi:MAG: hypothetical protein ACREJD_07895 [Phycisphaerales bacterium]
MNSKHLKLASLALVAFAGNALAVNTFWTGNAGDSRWNNAANWSPAHIPNNGDAVYIGSNGPVIIGQGEIGVAASVSCTIEMSIIGGLYVNGTALLAGHTFMYGSNPGIYTKALEITGQFEYFNGTINNYLTASTAHIAAGATMTIRTSAAVTVNTYLTVDGRLDVNDASLSVLGDANFPVGLIAGAGGTISINGNSTVHGNTFSYLASDGTVVLTGFEKFPKIDSDMKFFNGNYAVLRVDGGCYAQIGNPAQIPFPGGPLSSGYWYLKDNSTLLFPDGRDVTSIEANGRVIIEGPGSVFHSLSHVSKISSSLSLRNGADLYVNPTGGFLTQQGFIDISSGSRLSVEGSFTCTPASSITTFLTGMTTAKAGTIYARDMAHLDGYCLAVFDTGFAASGEDQAVAILEAGPSGAGVDSTFADFQSSSAPGHANALYKPYTANVALTCRADLNNDGYVDDSDFVIFVYSYNILDCTDFAMPYGCPADLNSDTVVDDADFVFFVTAYNTLICE